MDCRILRPLILIALASVLPAFFICRAASAQGAAWVTDHYDKQEVMIPMRDGVKLFTSIYKPKDSSHPYPIMMDRSPYSARPYGPSAIRDSLGPHPRFAEEGFIFVYQDVRGRHMSEGEFVNVRPHNPRKRAQKDIDESTDTCDTVDWLIKNVSHNNGRVGIWGISYPGFYASAAVIDSHPAIKAVSPQAPVSNWFIGDDFHHNGAFFLIDAFDFLNGFGRPHPEPSEFYPPGIRRDEPSIYKFFLDLGALRNVNERYFKNDVAYWNEMMAHPNYDSWWKARNIIPNLKNVHTAVMTVGGLFDAEDCWGAQHTYMGIEKQNPGIANTVVLGPWFHGGWSRSSGTMMGDISFDSDTSNYFLEHAELPFFNHYLKDAPDPSLPEAMIFQTGSNRWLSLPSWPPPGLKQSTLYLGEGKRLADSTSTGSDSYVSDPGNPVPYSANTTGHRNREYMIEDQRFASSRPDVLSYQTAPMQKDLSVAGPVEADLFVSTTGSDSDFVVKVIDVFPPDAPPNPSGVNMGDYQMLVRAEVMRARFRHSFEKPIAMQPGKVTEVKWELPGICHTFKKGHRMMIQVQSSWFPLIDRNPQKFVDIYQATDSDFQKATIHVFHSKTYPSRARFGVMEEPK